MPVEGFHCCQEGIKKVTKQSFGERLDEILLATARPLHVKGKHLMCKESKEAILALLKEVMPEGQNHADQWWSGWNSYRTELLKRFGM